MARSKTTTHHREIHHSHRDATTTIATAVPPASTPPLVPVVLPLPSAASRLLLPPIPPVSRTIPSFSVPQPIAVVIPTQVMSQDEFDEDTGFDHGTRSQSSSESEDSPRESP
ncbi:hypothetical protein Fot_37584 [Forsythia ovata]|uniref:Uncharacterized protein n=1 Tax=Forsythia ovata TaxID=205694 RepID=A0ABD1RZE0_9LAMI